MTRGAFGGREVVNDHIRIADHSGLFMAGLAGSLQVTSRQWKGSSLVMIEGRGRPAFRVMAVAAMSLIIFGELSAVNVRMTLLTNGGRALEFRLMNARGDLMTGAASHRTVSAG